MHAARNYQQGIQRLLAACDEDLLGQAFSEGKFRLDVSADFYDGMRVEREDLQALLRACTIANLVGEQTVAAAIEIGIIDAKNVLRVQGVPHAQMIVMQP